MKLAILTLPWVIGFCLLNSQNGLNIEVSQVRNAKDTSLLAYPASATLVEDIASINVGNSISLTIGDGVVLTSNDESIATVDETGTVTGIKYGSTYITATSGESYYSLPIIVDRPTTGTVFSQYDNFPSSQGANNFYIYTSDNGDFDNDVMAGLQQMYLIDNSKYNGGGWWDEKCFINFERVGLRTMGALSYKVTVDGNYTFDYKAWLNTDIRKNPDYDSWSDVDGWSVGLAKKDTLGNYSVLLSSIGTKENCHDDITRYKMGEKTLDAVAGEEYMFFYMSNGNAACDEVNNRFLVQINSTRTFDGNLHYEDGLKYVDDIPEFRIGDITTIHANRDDLNLTWTSNDETVATVDSTGKVTMVGSGVAYITATDGTFTKSLPVYSRLKDDASPVISQFNSYLTHQGENGLYIYSTQNGDIEDNLSAGLNGNISLLDDSAFNSENAWFVANTVFLNKERLWPGKGGALVYEAPKKGNYKLNYYAFLQHDVRTNADYNTWDVDGFSTAAIKIKTDGSVEVLLANIGTKASVIADNTRLQFADQIVACEKGERIGFAFVSNGNNSADEIHTGLEVQRYYVDGEERDIEISLSALNNHIDMGSTVQIDSVLVDYNNQDKVWSSSNNGVAIVDENGLVTGIGFGICKITLTISRFSDSLYIFVNGEYTYDKRVDTELKVNFDTSIKGDDFKVKMDDNIVGPAYYSLDENGITFLETYLQSLSLGDKNVAFVTSLGELNFKLTISKSDEPITTTSETTSDSTTTTSHTTSDTTLPTTSEGTTLGTTSENATTSLPTDSGNNGIGGGTIAIIVVGSVACATGIGYAIWSFLANKKKVTK